MKTRVINVRDVLHIRPLPALYVGRRMPSLFDGHPLGNPFRLPHGRKASESDRRDLLEKYRLWLAAHPRRDELLRNLAELVKVTDLPLACWCAPNICHANVLAEEVDRILERGDDHEEFV